jgi:two-component system, response regulator, stage 0 sporulation protein F
MLTTMSQEIRLLYVDDEPINLQLFEIVFKNTFQIVTAESGAAALDKIKQNSDISVIISDMKMPGMNGIEFIQQAKKELPKIPYFILTGFDMNEEIHAALQNKMICKCFKKPLNKEEIIHSVLEATKR